MIINIVIFSSHMDQNLYMFLKNHGVKRHLQLLKLTHEQKSFAKQAIKPVRNVKLAILMIVAKIYLQNGFVVEGKDH